MKLINFIKKYFFIIVCAILALIGTSLYLQNRQLKVDHATSVISQNDLKNTVTVEVQKDGTKVSTFDSKLIEVQNLKNLIKEKNSTIAKLTKDLHNVSQVSTTITQTDIDTIDLKYVKPIEFAFERNDSINEKQYSFNYRSTQDGLSIRNLKLTDTVTRAIGERRSWLFGASESIVKETHSNQYITTVGGNSFIVKQEKRWYDTRVFNIIVGALIGIGITK